MTAPSDARTLRLHVAHPLGRSSGVVRNFASVLQGLGYGSISVTSSAALQLERDWYARATQALDSAQWLLLMFGERSLERDWWLWEAGYFAARHPELYGRTVCMHHPDLKAPRMLRDWRTVPATPEATDDLLREVLGAHAPPDRPPVLSSAEGRPLLWLRECLLHCCVPSNADQIVDPAHAG